MTCLSDANHQVHFLQLTFWPQCVYRNHSTVLVSHLYTNTTFMHAHTHTHAHTRIRVRHTDRGPWILISKRGPHSRGPAIFLNIMCINVKPRTISFQGPCTCFWPVQKTPLTYIFPNYWGLPDEGGAFICIMIFFVCVCIMIFLLILGKTVGLLTSFKHYSEISRILLCCRIRFP